MDAAKSAQDETTFKKDMSFLMMPLFNPGSMWATLFSGRQTYSALNTGPGKAFSAKFLGGMGAGAGTATLVAGATALGLALKALTITVKQTMAAYENARQIYAKALTNGMGTQFTVKRSMLAQIMGVSEQDVFRFGAQMAYLNPKLEWAANILSRTTTPLTQVSWEFKILGEDMKAMFATLAADAKPAVMGFIESLDELVKFLNKKKLAVETGARIGMVIATGGASEIQRYFFKKKGEQNDSQMPSPQAWMKQLPASHWEKMGLVTMGGSANYAKDTARNTKDIANGIHTLVQNVIKNPGSSPWNMSPKTAQP
jgi:hypothetical protein